MWIVQCSKKAVNKTVTLHEWQSLSNSTRLLQFLWVALKSSYWAIKYGLHCSIPHYIKVTKAMLYFKNNLSYGWHRHHPIMSTAWWPSLPVIFTYPCLTLLTASYAFKLPNLITGLISWDASSQMKIIPNVFLTYFQCGATWQQWVYFQQYNHHSIVPADMCAWHDYRLRPWNTTQSLQKHKYSITRHGCIDARKCGGNNM